MTTIFISDRAYADIVNETLQNARTETGGILLGARVADSWYVVESLDPGPLSILRPAYFEYDHKYVNHLANKVRKRYKAGLRLLGLWHRHPGSLDTFSSVDDSTHQSYLTQCSGSAISGLINIDPYFRITFYEVTGSPMEYRSVPVQLGDRHIPQQYLAKWDGPSLLQTAFGHATSPSPRDASARGPNVSLLSRVFRPLRPCSMDRSHTEGLTKLSEGSTSHSSGQLDALEMLDAILPELDAHGNLDYQISMTPQGVRLLVKPTSQYPYAQISVEFLLTSDNGQRLISCGKECQTFRPGIVTELLSTRQIGGM